jgi:hypothetical protein
MNFNFKEVFNIMNAHLKDILSIGIGGSLLSLLLLACIAKIRIRMGYTKTLDEVFESSKPKNAKQIFIVLIVLSAIFAFIVFQIF